MAKRLHMLSFADPLRGQLAAQHSCSTIRGTSYPRLHLISGKTVSAGTSSASRRAVDRRTLLFTVRCFLFTGGGDRPIRFSRSHSRLVVMGPRLPHGSRLVCNIMGAYCGSRATRSCSSRFSPLRISPGALSRFNWINRTAEFAIDHSMVRRS